MSTEPRCPKCGARMKKRVARKGPFAGNEFWGCSNYPRCKGIINITNNKNSNKAATVDLLSRIHEGEFENADLLEALYYLREEIKSDGERKHGKRPVVCSDDALISISELLPRNLNDLKGIPKIGPKFIESYGEQFINVVNDYTETDSEKSVELTAKLDKVLHTMANQLVKINRRNRLLYMPKAANKYGVDLYAKNTNVVEKIYRDGKRLSIKNDTSNEPQSNQLYKKTVQLLREVEKDVRDKGHNDLYIGYPFAKGRIPGENFDIRCPLALFPVNAEKTPQEIKIMIDETRDIVYNNTLILSYLKFNNIINKELPEETVEEYGNDGTFKENLILHYNDVGIEILDDKSGLIPFREYKSGTFPEYRQGELHLEECIVLGKFPIRDSSIHRDFDKILESGEINALLAQLLENTEDVDYSDDSIIGECELTDDEEIQIPENSLVYINDLNSSQEAVLSAIENVDGLVVQGPPGTGKSQTITSLIADFACKGKTVMMVSEKKTALDVVYSRLGNLSKYALMIDDTNNKELFYKQLSSMIDLRESSSDTVDYNKISEEIDDLIAKLEVIGKQLYGVDEEFKVEPYKIYRENIGVREHSNDDIYLAVQDNIDDKVLDFDYKELRNIKARFSKKETANNLVEYHELLDKHSVVANFYNNITRLEIRKCKKQLKDAQEAVRVWNNKNIVSRIFSKKKITAKLNEEFHSYINEEKVGNVAEALLKNIDSYVDAISVYDRFQELKPIADSLDEDENLYFNLMNRLKDENGVDILELNKIVYNFTLLSYLEKFEAENRSVLAYVDSFEDIINEISDKIQQKKELVRKQLEQVLANNMHELYKAKRIKDIQRRIESKRKKSVNAFLNEYNMEIFNSVRIWLLTPEVVSEIMPLRKGRFDLVVFDEASQMYTEKGVPAIFRAKKVVVAGDHKQLRPTNLFAGRVEYDIDELEGEDEEINAAIEEESLLDLARFKYRDILLNFHYRSDYEELIDFSNHAFYNGKLYVSPNVKKTGKPPIEVHKLDNGKWVNRSNLEEAKYIVELIKQFFVERREGETIGVITFNITQRDLIEDLIDEEMAVNRAFATQIKAEVARKRDGEDIGLFIKNIENVQGDERDVIIFSIGYAKNEKGRVVSHFGWLNQKGGENRLNVAISRAKKKIHIVTSILPSELQVSGLKNKGPKILKKYLEYSFAVSNRDEELAKQILYSFGDDSTTGTTIRFDSPFEEEVYDHLVSCGYTVDTQVGIGGYSIDMAIKMGDRYILGIECDGRLYHSSENARERDYHRQKYLESRGWKIHRIWSTNWWKNSNREIEKIRSAITAIVVSESKADSEVEKKSINEAPPVDTKRKTNRPKFEKPLNVKTNNKIGDTRTVSEKKRCENCKYYKKEDCGGLRLCDDYDPVPIIDEYEKSLWPTEGDASYIRKHGKGRR